jgi:alpha-tubulin suppressor-like RCC1 family protein
VGSDTPVQVAGGFAFQSIAAGGDHSCGILTNGGVVCWGSNIDGQLGNGSVGGLSATPVAIAGGGTFTRISASTGTTTLTPKFTAAKAFGHGHTCALTSAGAVFCWGDDTDRQLGRGVFSGSGASSGTPQQISQGERGAGVTFTSISTGSRHSCGVGSDGNAYCWGSNVMGGLGNTLQAAFRGQPQKVATPN